MLRIVTTAALVAGFGAPVHARAQPGPAPVPAGIRADTVHFTEIPDPPTTLMEGLAGRAEGLNVQWSSGSIGTAPRVWSRGIRSFTLNTYPLIVVDGSVIWPNPVQQMDAGAQHASVLDILDPEQFESITVLPGPAATARYGAKAAAGVTEIRTRRPARGTLRTHAFAGLVAHSDPMDYPDSFGRMGTVAGGGSTVFCTVEAEAIGACTPTGAVHTGNRLREGTALRTGYGTRLGAAVNGGSQLGGFRVAASRLDEAGVLLSNKRERTSVLLLGHATPLPGLRVEGAVTHGTLSTELPYGDNHAFGRIPNSLLQHPFSGPGLPQFFPLPPTDDFYRNGLDVDRTHLRATVDYRLVLPWLSVGIDLGRENIRSERENRVDAVPSLNLSPYSSSAEGRLTVDERRVRLSASPRLARAMRLRSTVGYEQFELESSAAGRRPDSSWEERFEQEVSSAFAQSTLELSSFAVSAAVNRSDQGQPNDRMLWSWSTGATWRLAEFPAAARSPVLRALTLRGAAGATERLPAGAAAPERMREMEAGVDVRFSDDWQMYGTGYALQTDSLFRRVGPAVTNDGSLENRGLELGVRGSGALRGDTRWWMNGSAALNRNRYDAATPAFPGHGVASGPIMVVPGDPVGGYYTRPIIGMQDRNGNDRIDANTCPGAECEITIGEEPVFLGTSIPPRLASLALGVRSERGIALSMRLDHQGAVKRLNDTEAFRCQFEICGRLYDPATTDQQRAELAALRMEFPIGFVENADFVKLREVALTLTAPEHLVGGAASGRSVQLTVSGRNLHTWTGYSGLDPETSAWGGVPYGAVEFLTQPLPRTFSTQDRRAILKNRRENRESAGGRVLRPICVLTPVSHPSRWCVILAVRMASGPQLHGFSCPPPHSSTRPCTPSTWP